MTAILYIETNFLLSFAAGRDKGTDDLTSNLFDSGLHVRLVIPAVCFMETCSTYELLKKRHEKFLGDLRDKINECKRGFAWLDQGPHLEILQRSLVAFEVEFWRFRGRLDFAFHMLGVGAERIELSENILLGTARNRIIEDGTDNLILTSILEHARAHRGQEKAFLTENSKDFHDNREAQRALKDVGIRYFRKGQGCLDWVNSLRPQPNNPPPRNPEG